MGEMIGNIAHQWRQPINALGLLLANIKDAYEFGELNREEMSRQMETGNRLIQKMSATIDDFRDFFRPNKEKAPFRLAKVVAEVKSILGASLAHHGIFLDEQVSVDVNALGYANECAQVLLNLVNNAKEALVERKVAGGVIRVSVGMEDGMAVVRVADNGGGIPEDVLPKIFDPYFTTKPQGTGIGLYMSKIIVENNMGGRIEARNVEGGAEFAIFVAAA
jgi:signal transduction histidine kinase